MIGSGDPMQPILLLLFFILLIIIAGTILLLTRESKQTENKQMRPRNEAAIEEMPDDPDKAMAWLESLAQKESESHQTELPQWLLGFKEQDEDTH
jgi:flagellar biosynthesis/type III secretory pathway M-ring protein FliF/YscJ